MPKFHDHEREYLAGQLLKEGELLFSTNGLIKVTIQNLTSAVGISKGSFYAFYESKELLFMDINYRAQQEMYHRLQSELAKLADHDPNVITVSAFLMVLDCFMEHPFLSKINQEVVGHLQRRLGNQLFHELNYDDTRLLRILEQKGIEFYKSDMVIVKALQSILAAVMHLKGDSDLDQVKLLLVQGLVDQILKKESL